MWSQSCQALDFESNHSHTTVPSTFTTTFALQADETTDKALTEQTADANSSTSTVMWSSSETDSHDDVRTTRTVSITGKSAEQNESSDYATTTTLSPFASFTTTADQTIEIIDNVTEIPIPASSGNWSQIGTCRLTCQHGARCVNDDTGYWCKCSWAFSGRHCESVLPLYFALSLVGGGVILLFLFGLSILLCVKLATSKRTPVQTKAVDRTSFTDTFHKPEPGAVYVDPSVYYGTLCRTTLTPSRLSSGGGRPRLNLESFENSHYQQQQPQNETDEQAMISSSRMSYSPPRNNGGIEPYHSPYKNRNSCNETRIDDVSSPLPHRVLNS